MLHNDKIASASDHSAANTLAELVFKTSSLGHGPGAGNLIIFAHNGHQIDVTIAGEDNKLKCEIALTLSQVQSLSNWCAFVAKNIKNATLSGSSSF